ncbi:MAG: tetratricopeptide repeat protein [Elusimicrobia bacterium]|nr:tetratricopeptide repeat protein [Elusimicrobiota bacterium]
MKRSRWVRLGWVAAFTAVAAALFSWGPHRSSFFPRTKFQFLSAGQLSRRVEKARKILEEDPENLAAWMDLGLSYFQSGKETYADAINALEQARELGGVDPRIFYYLGVLYQEVGLYQFAIPEYERFLRNFPEDRDSRLLLAKLLYQKGNLSRAVGHYEQLYVLYPQDAMVLENLGLSLAQIGEAERAEEILQAMRRLGQASAQRASFYLARFYLGRKEYLKSLEYAHQAVPLLHEEARVSAAQVYEVLAQAYEATGDLKMSRLSWNNVLRYDPKNLQAVRKAIQLADQG